MLTAFNATPPEKSKMAARGPQSGQWGLERCLTLTFANKFFDPSTPSMRKVDDGETKRQAGAELGQAQLKLGLCFTSTIDS